MVSDHPRAPRRRLEYYTLEQPIECSTSGMICDSRSLQIVFSLSAVHVRGAEVGAVRTLWHKQPLT